MGREAGFSATQFAKAQTASVEMTGFGWGGRGNDNGKDVPGIANKKKGEGIFTLSPFIPYWKAFLRALPSIKQPSAM
jgi:hypothetical protein